MTAIEKNLILEDKSEMQKDRSREDLIRLIKPNYEPNGCKSIPILEKFVAPRRPI